MAEILLFGGTGEGRKLAELLARRGVATLVLVATEYGESLLTPGKTLRVHAGRLNEAQIAELIARERPRLVIDATHPYACAVSDTLESVCAGLKLPRVRILREACADDGCVEFDGMDALIDALNARSGQIFSMLGAKEAAALRRVENYRERVWLRVLPSPESLSICLSAGYPARHIICMQGPFSEEMNHAMLRSAQADVIVTKESGRAGGFPEKLAAARALGIPLWVLRRPRAEAGLTLEAAMRKIEEGTL